MSSGEGGDEMTPCSINMSKVVSHVGDSEISPAADGEHLVHKFIGEGNLVSQDPGPFDPGGSLCGQQGIAGVSVRGVDCLL